jgi:hypothetical protein
MKHLALIALLLLSISVRAADDADNEKDDDNDTEVSTILKSVGYPELQVVPRASERLAMESKAERGSWFVEHWPVELSGLFTLYVGNSSRSSRRENLTDKEKADAQTIATVTTTVGAGWLIGGLIMGGQHPYGTAAKAIGPRKGKDERSMLLRERLSEEALERPAKTMRVLQYVSVLTNAGVNALNIPYTNDKGKVTAGLGVILAFLPMMFTDHSIDVYDKHIEYKKKIYAPLETASFHYEAYTKTFTPMTNLIWTF